MDFKNWIFLIENRVLSEISEKDATLVKNWYRDNENKLPFSDIFGAKKTRLVIPVENDLEAESILNRIKSLKATIDFSSGLISVFDEKTNKYRETKLGKFILDKKSPFTEEEKKWWIHQGDPLKALKLTSSQSDYAVIISRHPIDLIRMSDHDNWTSCHGPLGTYFNCALAESKGSGAIAYVIKKSDLARINLDDDEIFEDRNRGISGVSPISRVRLRKFVHKKDGYDLAVPENRVYGVAFPGFLETVRSWSLDKQQPKIGTKRPSMREFELKGGSYRDTAAGTLFNYFFGDDEDGGDSDYSGEEDNADEEDNLAGMGEIWEQEIAEINARYEGRINKAFHYSAEVDYAQAVPYVLYSGGMRVDLPQNILKNINEEKFSQWNVKRKILSHLNSSNFPMMTQILFVDYEKEPYFLIDFDNEGVDNPDEYEDALYNLSDYDDDDVKKFNAEFYKILLDNRIVSLTAIANFVQDFDEESLKNFDLVEDDALWSLELKKPILVQSETKSIDQAEETNFTNLVLQKLQNWADKILQAKKQQKMHFDPEYVNFHKRPFAQDFAIKPFVEFKLINKMQERPPFRWELNFRIVFREIDKDEDFLEVKEFVQFIDQNFEEFQKLIGNVWFTFNK